ncbi:hypothetical protein CSAL01_04660 [Colletotrichum salicis]|uniref:Uncharacterized protein n=1 Tax=Colletotrichum salicis TaxID=1209931 RepID=A0A135RWL4_9PEZI|nr:hypothetical protein CSAL01_04660 [Colletotrichum salicis]
MEEVEYPMILEGVSSRQAKDTLIPSQTLPDKSNSDSHPINTFPPFNINPNPSSLKPRPHPITPTIRNHPININNHIPRPHRYPNNTPRPPRSPDNNPKLHPIPLPKILPLNPYPLPPGRRHNTSRPPQPTPLRNNTPRPEPRPRRPHPENVPTHKRHNPRRPPVRHTREPVLIRPPPGANPLPKRNTRILPRHPPVQPPHLLQGRLPDPGREPRRHLKVGYKGIHPLTEPLPDTIRIVKRVPVGPRRDASVVRQDPPRRLRPNHAAGKYGDTIPILRMRRHKLPIPARPIPKRTRRLVKVTPSQRLGNIIRSRAPPLRVPLLFNLCRHLRGPAQCEDVERVVVRHGALSRQESVVAVARGGVETLRHEPRLRVRDGDVPPVEHGDEVGVVGRDVLHVARVPDVVVAADDPPEGVVEEGKRVVHTFVSRPKH